MRISDWSSDVCSSDLLFSGVTSFLPGSMLDGMLAIVSAVEKISALPAYQQAVLAYAPQLAREDHGPHGVFMGYDFRSEEHTSELQSLMRISYAVFCLKKKSKR